jgi:hypothetical protein
MSKTAKTRWTTLALVVFATLSLLPAPCTAADAWPSRTVQLHRDAGTG